MAELEEVKPDKNQDRLPQQPLSNDAADQWVRGVIQDTKQSGVDLADLTARKIRDEDRVVGTTLNRLEGDRGIAMKHLNAEGIGPDKLDPWDIEKQRSKYETSPIEKFGSLGSVFGILASAFTHAPMENALNASAAAMNAIKANDDKEYDRAYTAWKANMDLVQKRFDMQHTMYNDALNLMGHDQQAGQIMLNHTAARFGDQHMQYLLEHGMAPEIVQLQTARVQQMKEMTAVKDQITESSMRRTLLDNMNKTNNPNNDAMRNFENWKYIYGVREPWQDELTKQFMLTLPPDMPPEERVKKMEDWAVKLRGLGSRTSNSNMSAVQADFVRKRTASLMIQHPEWSEDMAQEQAMQDLPHPRGQSGSEMTRVRTDNFKQAVEEFKEKNNREPTAKEKNDILADTYRRPMTNTIGADFIRNRAGELVKDNPEMSPTEAVEQATKDWKNANAPPMSGNKRFDVEGHIEQYGRGVELIDKITKTLDKYVGAAGVAGKGFRLSERLNNLVGRNQTDRVQMMRDISQLQLLAPRLLLDQSSGRPLSAEASHVMDIVAGLNMGDTTANTLRAMKELKQELLKIQTGVRQRIGEDTPEPPATPAAESGPRWKQAPVTGGP